MHKSKENVPREKLSKKAKKQLNREKRLLWSRSPVTRRPSNPKAYKRRKEQIGDDEHSSACSFCLPKLQCSHCPAAC